MRSLQIALSFLTTIPMQVEPAPEADELGRSAGWFPWIGAGIGLITAGVYWGLLQVLPTAVAAILSVMLCVSISGGLHQDGLADCCDGMLNASRVERRLEIMKDPRVGTFGVLGLIFDIGLRIMCLTALPMTGLIALPLAGALSRWMLIPAASQPLARPGGMGASFAAGLTRKSWLPAIVAVIVAMTLANWRGLIALAAAHLAALGVFGLARRRLGGITGDVYGLLIEVVELTVLIIFCIQ